MKKIAENILSSEYSSKILPGVHFPTRTIFIELNGNEVLLISPGPFEEKELKKNLSQYSKVYCATLNSTHHRHLRNFHDIYPEVPIYGPSSILKKQPWIQGVLKSLDDLKAITNGQLSFVKIEGNQLLDETVLYCQRSKSLITTDLLFNMREPMPWGRKQLLRLVGAYDKIAQSKLLKSTTKDMLSYKKSIQTLKVLDCERIILNHGDVITGSLVREAFEAIS